MKNLTKFQLIIFFGASIITLAIIAHTFVAPDGWQQRQKVRDDLGQLQKQNLQLKAQIDALKQEVHALRTNPQYQERAVRKELGFVNKDDIILELSPDVINPPNPSKAPEERLKK